MYRYAAFFLGFLFCIFSQDQDVAANQSTQAAFSPSAQAIELIERTIGKAEHEVDVAAYSFTSEKVAAALIDAHRRGVDVRVLLDKGQGKRHYKAIGELSQAGIPIRINSRYAIMHDKYLIIDGKTIETGSFNYTASAEKRNAENVVVIKNNKRLAGKYIADWQRLWSEGEDYTSIKNSEIPTQENER